LPRLASKGIISAPSFESCRQAADRKEEVAAQIVHWFNPLIWYSFAKMREDCELACDAATLSFLKPEEYQSYGLSIISLVTPVQVPWLPGTTGFFGKKNNQQIKRRIKMIKFFRKPTLKWTYTANVWQLFLH